MKYVKIILAVVVFLVMSIWTTILYRDAIISWWIVPSVTLAVGAATGLHMWRPWRFITGSDNMWLNLACHAVFTAAFLSFIFFGVNKMLADRSKLHSEKAVVTAHYKQEHDRTRRVRRGRYIPTGEKYYTYSLEIMLRNGEAKTISVPLSRYNNVRNGDSVSVPVCKGLLGVTVLQVDSIKYPAKKKKARRRIPLRRMSN